ncbi:MAG: methyltransferase domain-containing protein [Ancalomicrobiaceae bacterium]|nr:methyltransferase domain-containing protein [Ancalomicrobiaceae bacterium]
MSQAHRRRAGGDIKTKMLDELRFLRNWIGNPLKTGAVAPSGPALARSMAGYIDTANAGTVVELGPGTGVVTEAILERGIAASRLVSIEYSPDFCALLRERFPGVHFLQGDAYGIRTNLAGIAELPLAAVVSSLPLFTRPPAERQRLINTALDMLAPGAPFIQFSYAFVPPVPHGAGDFTIERSNWILMNLPPARVWIYRRPARG